MREVNDLLEVGSTDGYQWLVSSENHFDVPGCCPDVVMGKRVAVTSLDSGPLRLTEEQKAGGWVSQGGIAYSPEIQQTNAVPLEYFSEVYVFNTPTNLGALADPKTSIFDTEMRQGQVTAFVNFDFGFHDTGYTDISRMFWKQFDWIKPESYLAVNDYLIFVTTNRSAFLKVHEALQKAGRTSDC